MFLERINSPEDLRKLSPTEQKILASEIREFLIEKISVTGGHLASNLGVVELTMAIHLAFSMPRDKVIWDVGHQSYTHKILTGRKDGFDNLRKFGGMSGFPKRNESEYDCFNTGHSSTSISAGLGMVRARDLDKEDYSVVSVIGDGSLTGGMAFEAMNNAAELKTNFIIILNDNEMSISENVGGLSNALSSIRTADAYTGLKSEVVNALESIPVIGEKTVKQLRKTKRGIKQLVIPGMLFENMGLTYLGPVDGHNINQMVAAFNHAKKLNECVLVHVVTRKGKGYSPAERHPSRFHGTSPFEIETGIPKDRNGKANYTDVFSTVIRKLGERNPKVVAITAAMSDGTGLKRFKLKYPDRFFDVGIAEEHAVTFAAGLAAAGYKPIFCVYSSFLQRAYDQVLHDVCMQNLPVVFAIDRAGIVGCDGETHHGLFDLSYLSTIPNMTILAPKNKWELSDMMKFAVEYDGPIAIRYPRGEAYDGLKEYRADIEYGKSELIYDETGSDREKSVALFAVGSMVAIAEGVREDLKAGGYNCMLVNARFVKPFDREMINRMAKTSKLLVTMEENVLIGGFGQQVLDYTNENHIDVKVINIAVPDRFIEHGSVSLLRKDAGIDKDTIVSEIIKEMD
ncbi:MAG: 1-deoxy-D-xylulose-5-phosphate synthase [Lachnospiraceae bacterium]|nr:1-deoxy-D-xylulose-5-phosphate synthase [Lachnospiraceae bacterium]